MYAAADIPQMTKSIRTPVYIRFSPHLALVSMGRKTLRKLFFLFAFVCVRAAGAMTAITAAIAGAFALLLSYVRSYRNGGDYRNAGDYQNNFLPAHFFYAPFASLTLLRITMSATATAITAAQMNAVHQKEPIV